MTTTLTTDWIKIGQSGPTVDKRRIEPAWLEQSAETYTTDTYTAVIWVDHWRFLGSMGKVVAVKAEKTGNIVSLYAKLQPNEWLMSYNAVGQKLFTSMEIDPDFAETGKAYLVGLAITDEPASLGTHEIRFSARKQRDDNVILCGVEFDMDCMRANLTDNGNDSTIVAMFRKFVAQFGKDIHNNPGETPKPDEDTMNEQQFNQVMGKFDEQAKRMDALEEKFAALTPEPEGDGKNADPATDPDKGQQDFSAQLAEAMKPFGDKLDGLKVEFTGKVDELTKRFEQAKPGTTVPETDSPANGARVL